MASAGRPLVGEKVSRLLALSERWHAAPRARFGANGCALTAAFEHSARAIAELEVRPDDVWVVTAPKCGTTWMQEMVWLIVHDLDYEGAKEEIFRRSPFLEISKLMTFENNESEETQPHPDTLNEVINLASPRCIKSHLHKDLLPTQIWTKKPKVIYVAREPKDAAVSYYYHDKMLSGYKGDREFFFETFFDDIVLFAPYWEHTLDFWKIKDEPHILFVTYEEMKQDLPAIIRRVASFLDKSLTEADVARLADHLDIKKMRENPAVNSDRMISKLRSEGKIGDDERFIRKGVVGEGRREMSPEMAAMFDERTRRVFGDAPGGCPWKL